MLHNFCSAYSHFGIVCETGKTPWKYQKTLKLRGVISPFVSRIHRKWNSTFSTLTLLPNLTLLTNTLCNDSMNHLFAHWAFSQVCQQFHFWNRNVPEFHFQQHKFQLQSVLARDEEQKTWLQHWWVCCCCSAVTDEDVKIWSCFNFILY